MDAVLRKPVRVRLRDRKTRVGLIISERLARRSHVDGHKLSQGVLGGCSIDAWYVVVFLGLRRIDQVQITERYRVEIGDCGRERRALDDTPASERERAVETCDVFVYERRLAQILAGTRGGTRERHAGVDDGRFGN